MRCVPFRKGGRLRLPLFSFCAFAARGAHRVQENDAEGGEAVVTAALTLLLLALLAGFPAESGAAAREALALVAGTVLPALFPFFVLSSLAVLCGLPALLARPLARFMRPLFGVGGAGAGALLLGLLGGYPAGARTAAELFSRGELERREAEQLLCFCNNTGPAFFLGMCAEVFGSVRAGAYLYLVHVLSALLTGILLRRRLPRGRETRCAPARPLPLGAALPAAVQGALTASLSVGGYVVLFMVLLRLFSRVLPLGGLSPLARAGVCGFFELTNGIAALPPTREGFVLCAVLLNWGGLSVLAQTRAVLESTGLSLRRGILGKAVQAALGVPLALLAARRLF